ncbi:MAG: molybdopterin-dependent oxidoreductase [Tissierellia bacterium]|nr:molybdopterin-dependent oxidoreductase [Tissierellia bacterium]
MKKRGRGIGLSFYGTGYGNGFPDVSNAWVRLLKDGKIGVYVGGAEVGQGAMTAFVQIAAEALGVPHDRVLLEIEDTLTTPDSGTAAATRQTYNTGNAIKIACENFKEKLKEVAKDILNLNSTAALEVKDGEVYLEIFPQKRVSLEKIADFLGGNILEAEGSFTAQTTKLDPETGQGAPYWPYTFSACGVELEVDTITGQVDILKAVLVQDVGRAVNPHLVEGQMDGGYAMALGYALFEDLNLKRGVMGNRKFSKYLIPTSMDVTELTKIIVEDPESTAPYGAKGIGEPVMIPVTPAILNAIYDATGVRITELPITPEKLAKAFSDFEKEG